MTLKIEEFNVNYITAVGGKSLNGLKFTTLDIKILISFRELSFMEEWKWCKGNLEIILS